MASPILNTPEGDTGENGSNPMPSLKQYLCDLPGVYQKLEKSGMSDIDIFIHITDDDLNTLCNAENLNLKFMDSVKFKSKIRSLRQKYGVKKEVQIVSVSKQEQMALNELKYGLKQCQDLEKTLSAHINRTEDIVINMRANVDDEFNEVSKALEGRKKYLYQKV